MPVYIDPREVKAEARALLQSASVPPLRFTLLYLAIDLVLSLISTAANRMLGSTVALSTLSFSFSFVGILISLFSAVLLAGYLNYCLGVQQGASMPYDSLFSAFPYAGRVILLALAQGLLIALGCMLLIVPGILLAFAYSFSFYHLCEEPDTGIVDALRRSRMEMRGYKMQLFSLLLSFLPLLILVSLPVSACDYFLSRLLPDTFAGEMLYALILSVLSGCASLYVMPYLSLAQVIFYRRATAPAGDGFSQPPQDEDTFI